MQRGGLSMESSEQAGTAMDVLPDSLAGSKMQLAEETSFSSAACVDCRVPAGSGWPAGLLA